MGGIVEAMSTSFASSDPAADSDPDTGEPRPDRSAPGAGTVVDKSTPARAAAQRLRDTLRLNATTSMLGGLTAAVAAGPLDRVLGTGQVTAVRLVGAGLFVFAVDVLAVAGARISRLRRWAPVIVVGDALWVAGSIAAIVAGWFSATGAVVVSLVAVMVGAFAVRQWTSWRRFARVDVRAVDEAPPVEVVHVERRIDVAPDVVWTVVTDHDLYGRLAPNLSAVRVDGHGGAISPDGTGLHRTCTNRRGASWREACTLWEPRRRFEVAVDTSDYPYPLTEMRGSWWVVPRDDGGSIAGMDFRFRPSAGVRGRVFAVVMQAAFPVVLRRILRGWERAARAHSSARRSEQGPRSHETAAG